MKKKKSNNDINFKHLRLALVGVWVLCLIWVWWPVMVMTGKEFLIKKNEMMYGWMVVPVAVGMAWSQREKLLLAAGRPAPGGLTIMAGAFVLHWLGRKNDFLPLSQLAMILSVPAVAWVGWGREVARVLIFPTSFLLFIIPLHFFGINSESLCTISGIGAHGLMNVLGIPCNLEFSAEADAIRKSVCLVHPSGVFDFKVAGVCSGMRMVVVYVMFSAFLGYFLSLAKWRIILLMACSVPIMMSANILRITTLCALSIRFGQEQMMGSFHDWPGIFYVGIAACSILLWAGNMAEKKGGSASRASATPPARQLDWPAGIHCLLLGIFLTILLAVFA